MTRPCSHCSGPLPYGARRHTVFCSGACRVAAHRARRRIPAELRGRDRWVRRVGKRPVTVTGRAASSTNAATWSSFASATASTTGDGFGFVLNGDGLCCIDLDHALVDGVLTAAAERVLGRLPASFTEVSMSGEGLHVFGFGWTSAGRRLVVDGQAVEVYGRDRFIAVTGRVFRPGPLVDLAEAAAALVV